jgi:hypothetical protein
MMSDPRILQFVGVMEVNGRNLSVTWNQERTDNTTHTYLSDFPLNGISNRMRYLAYNLVVFVSL